MINTSSKATYGTLLCWLERCGFELIAGLVSSPTPDASRAMDGSESLGWEPLPALTGLRAELLLCSFRQAREEP